VAGLKAAALLAEELCPTCAVDPGSAAADDPVEGVFEALELEEVAECFRRKT
jgi:hypothetical protein